jgi:Zn-dependent M28 family amino/carboxypeptidase
MRKIVLTGLSTLVISFLFAQDIDKLINVKDVERIERVLSADEMKGRRPFTPEIEKAAGFIASEFKAAGLKPLGEANSFLQEFTIVRPKLVELKAKLNGADVDPKSVIVITAEPELKITEESGYIMGNIRSDGNLSREASAFIRSGRNMIIMVDTAHAAGFGRVMRRTMFKGSSSVVFILGKAPPAKYKIEVKHEVTEQKLSNVVGILPGKSKKNEFVIFSAHYDHIGTGKPVENDSIYNGANDDAAGTTAVMMLAKYFAANPNNERTLVFAAFTAEEMGGFGSQYFSGKFDPEAVKAMFNIEMIGTESKWGKNSAYITGFELTDMGSILQKNLKGTEFSFNPDPYPSERLFYRSDNATLARLGVPAHTISTSKMDGEPHYHKLTDHIETLDLNNMTMIIRSIAVSAKTIISGKDTPSRVKVDTLR